MLIHQKSDLELCSDPVRSGKKDRFFHILDLLEGESAGKASKSAEDFGPHGALYVLFHKFHAAVAGFNIDSGALII